MMNLYIKNITLNIKEQFILIKLYSFLTPKQDKFISFYEYCNKGCY